MARSRRKPAPDPRDRGATSFRSTFGTSFQARSAAVARRNAAEHNSTTIILIPSEITSMVRAIAERPSA